MSQFYRILLFTILLINAKFMTVNGQTFASLPYVDSAWTKAYKPFRIAGDLYYVGTYDLACFLITTDQGNILINTGLASSVATIKNNITALGFDFMETKILLTTQGHYDHVAGMAEIKQLTGASMMVHEGDVAVLEDGGKSDFIFGGKKSLFAPIKVDEVLQDQDTIRLGTLTLLALHHPGHTKGATSFLFETTNDNRTWKVLIANIPSILSETRISGMPSYPKVGEDYGETLQKMDALQFDLWVASHASQFGLHEKRKEDDRYDPKVFSDRKLYDDSLKRIKAQYDKLKEKK